MRDCIWDPSVRRGRAINQVAGKTMRRLPFFRIASILLAALGMAALCPGPSSLPGETGPWREADKGLMVAQFQSDRKGAAQPFSITVVKVAPGDFSLRLLCASELGKEKLTTKEWCERHKLVAAANAGMFQEDGLTSVGFMKNFKHVNNPKLGRANTVLAFNPVDEGVPQVQIIDRECQDFNGLRHKYQTFVQSIRMISCDGQNVWSRQNSKWSTLAIGMDSAGDILFMFSKAPHSVHDFIEIILSLPLSLKSAMYLEGGPQASLYLSTPKLTLELNGAWEGFEENAIQFSLPIPNVIGITRKPRTSG